MRRQVKIQYVLVLLMFALVMPGMVGCQNATDADADSFQKPPKPVSTMPLRNSSPSFPRYTSATVAPWKAERMGFEQAGRVVEVIEPGELVTAQTASSKSPGGTILARLDDERLRIAVEAINADIEVVQRRLETNRVLVENRIPAGIESAEAELQLAERELQRANRLSNAISQSELDAIRTRATTAQLQVTSAKAELDQARAEQAALEAQVRQSQQRMAEAQRNLRNATLYSSFPGQVAEIHAVPGTYAAAGDPIVTVLMMDPMVVEFETTAETSRRYQRGDILNLAVTDKSGTDRPLTGAVYNVDSVADPETRTFTVTLHVRNQKTSAIPPAIIASAKQVARTKSISPLNAGSMIVADDRLLVDENAVHEIDGKTFVWKVTNRTADQSTTTEDRLLTVQPLEVRIVNEQRVSFLGRWNFIEVEFTDPEAIDVQRDLITGQLYFDDEIEGPISLEQWTVNEVMLDVEQWMLRAGDVARVALLPDQLATGFYVPMKAIRRENEQTFIHVVDSSNPQAIVRRVEVSVASQNSSAGESLLLQIESASNTPLEEGMEVVVGGTHFLKDGDRVRVVTSAEAGR